MKYQESSVISRKLWDEARRKFSEQYARSACLEDSLALLDAFADSSKSMYKSDFDGFLAEAKIEDFGVREKGSVVVSTIHKSKGREYDRVYVMLHEVGQITDEKLRAIYVGITRAKKMLRVHYSDPNLFEGIDDEGIVKTVCDSECAQPENVIVQLSHKDVVLDYFLDKKPLICALMSGHPLDVDGNFLVASVGGKRNRVVKFSQAFQRKLAELSVAGYRPSAAQVRYVVAWKKEEEADEAAVLLPDLYLSKCC